MSDDKVILVTPEQYNEIDVDATQMTRITSDLFGARAILSIDQDLELVKQGIKTRKPVQYGHKVVVRK